MKVAKICENEILNQAQFGLVLNGNSHDTRFRLRPAESCDFGLWYEPSTAERKW